MSNNNGKKTIDELRRDHKTFDKKDLVDIKGGKRSSWIMRRLFGDVTPQ